MTLEPLYDTHCHLDSYKYDDDREGVIARAHTAGVRVMLTCGADGRSSQRAIALAADYEGIIAAVGVHPHEARSSALASDDPVARRAARDDLAAMAGQPDVVAIGEIGLDYYYDFSPRATQRAVLQQQLALAVELEMPVILHVRESDSELRAIVDQEADSLRGVLHCFLSDRGMAAWALARGFYLGFGGALTFRNTKEVQAIAAEVPLDRILIETDAPYMAPYPHRGKRNEPAYVGIVAQCIARLRGCEAAEIAQRTFDNAIRLFGPSHHDS